MSRAGRYRIVLIAVCVLLLEAGCRLGLVDPHAIVPPSRMLVGAWEALAKASIRYDLLLTLENVVTSILLALIGGFIGGFLLYRLPRLRRALDPFLASYYAVPTFVFYPVFIVMFGLNRWPLIAIGFIFSVVAVAINTLDGLSRVPRVLLRTAQALHLSRWQTIVHLIVPAAAPWLFTGAKFAVAYSFIGVIAGEFVLSDAGLGHAIAFAYNSFDNLTMYGLILVLFGVVGGINMTIWIWEQEIYARRAGR